MPYSSVYICQLGNKQTSREKEVESSKGRVELNCKEEDKGRRKGLVIYTPTPTPTPHAQTTAHKKYARTDWQSSAAYMSRIMHA